MPIEKIAENIIFINYVYIIKYCWLWILKTIEIENKLKIN